MSAPLCIDLFCGFVKRPAQSLAMKRYHAKRRKMAKIAAASRKRYEARLARRATGRGA